MQIDVTSGAAASRLLADGSFERAWGSLAGQCPWATIYQSIAFARTWFACYPRYAPVIVSVAAASTIRASKPPLAAATLTMTGA